MALRMTQGDTRRFQVTLTTPAVVPTRGPTPAPSPVDLTGCTLTWTLTAADGTVVAQHSTTDGYVAVQGPATAGVAVVTVLPADTSGLPARDTLLTYRWTLVDALGNRTTTETDSFLVTP